jgi:hypothetical protein
MKWTTQNALPLRCRLEATKPTMKGPILVNWSLCPRASTLFERERANAFCGPLENVFQIMVALVPQSDCPMARLKTMISLPNDPVKVWQAAMTSV